MMTQEAPVHHSMAAQSDFAEIYHDNDNSILNKASKSPLLPIATTGFLGIAAWRVYQAKNRGGQRLSHYLIHTRLAAQGLGVAVLGSMVLYSLGQRAMNGFKESEE